MKKPSRGVYAVIGSVPQALAYVVVPIVVARSGRRHGWAGRRPGPVNLMGLVPIGAGAGLIGWAITSHYDTAPREHRATVIPDYLVTRGAYGVTRNPLYVGGGLLWTGWTITFGNVRVAAAGATWLSGIARLGVPFEERLLHRKFGGVYDDYAARVPRWIRVGRGRGRRDRPS